MSISFPTPFTALPCAAREEITHRHPSGVRKHASYYLGTELIWRRSWSRSGQLCYEQSFRCGVPHGLCRYWHDNSTLSHITFFQRGKEHGVSCQYDSAGNLLGTYTMIHGTGTDRWFEKIDNEPAMLAEERQYRNGNLHGFERCYGNTGDACGVWQESHFQDGVEHGIFRRWNSRGRLMRGYPQYYRCGERINKRRYLTACKHDPFLPPFRPEDNDCRRHYLEP